MKGTIAMTKTCNAKNVNGHLYSLLLLHRAPACILMRDVDKAEPRVVYARSKVCEA